jgi:hypothetical protein
MVECVFNQEKPFQFHAEFDLNFQKPTSLPGNTDVCTPLVRCCEIKTPWASLTNISTIQKCAAPTSAVGLVHAVVYLLISGILPSLFSDLVFF